MLRQMASLRLQGTLCISMMLLVQVAQDQKDIGPVSLKPRLLGLRLRLGWLLMRLPVT
jgi:hypothetical protein